MKIQPIHKTCRKKDTCPICLPKYSFMSLGVISNVYRKCACNLALEIASSQFVNGKSFVLGEVQVSVSLPQYIFSPSQWITAFWHKLVQ